MADPKTLAARGYRRVSRSHGMIARIDRPDWLEFVAEKMHTTVESLKASRPGTWESHYRRVYSKDVLTLNPISLALQVHPSDGDSTGYVE